MLITAVPVAPWQQTSNASPPWSPNMESTMLEKINEVTGWRADQTRRECQWRKRRRRTRVQPCANDRVPVRKQLSAHDHRLDNPEL